MEKGIIDQIIRVVIEKHSHSKLIQSKNKMYTNNNPFFVRYTEILATKAQSSEAT